MPIWRIRFTAGLDRCWMRGCRAFGNRLWVPLFPTSALLRPIRLFAHHHLAGILFHLGELAPARALLEQGMALYNPLQHRAFVLMYGQDPGVVCQSYAARPLWLLGYPDQALKRGYEALALAQELAHSPAWRLPSIGPRQSISFAATRQPPKSRQRR